MPTGKVEFLPGTVIGNPAFGGNEASFGKAFAFDGDRTTFFAADPTIPEFLGIDFGAGKSVTVTDFVLVARDEPWPTTTPLADQTNVWGLYVSDVSGTAGLTQVDDYTQHTEYVYRHQANDPTFDVWQKVNNPAAGRFIVFKPIPDGAAFSVGDARVAGAPAAGVNSRPMPPILSPFGGRFPLPTAPVTMSSATTSAAIYYTIDGTTPAVVAGVPQGTTALYNGNLSAVPSAGGQVIKAIAYDATCSTPSSTVQTATFYLGLIEPKKIWYDSSVGRKFQAMGGHVLTFNNRYWIEGFSQNRASGDAEYGSGMHLYRTNDFLRFECIKQITKVITPIVPNTFYQERPHTFFNPLTGKLVKWHVQADPGTLPTNAAQCKTADQPDGTWAVVTTNLSPNGHDYQDGYADYYSNGKAYLTYTPSARVGLWITELNAAGTNVTGNEVLVGVGTDKEAPVLFRSPWGDWILIYSDGSFYGSAPYNVKAVHGVGPDPVTAVWNTAGAYSPFASDPTATVFESQPNSVFCTFGSPRNYIYWGNYWNGPGSVRDLYQSAIVMLPITFLSRTQIRINMVASWDLNWFAGFGGTGASGGAGFPGGEGRGFKRSNYGRSRRSIRV